MKVWFDMGSKSKRNTPKGTAPRNITVTHEPMTPRNWPLGHVSVELTGMEHDECVKIKIHGITHFLHATTARELEKMLNTVLEEYNQGIRITNVEGYAIPEV